MTGEGSGSSGTATVEPKTEAKAKLRDLLRSREDGLVLTRDGYTVRQAVEDWLEHGLSNRDKATRDVNRHLCEKHVLPYLGARKLRDLIATEVDEWLATLATSLSTRTLQGVRACLNRGVRRAMARDKVTRNVVELTEVPAGVPGRPSKAMAVQQADDVITKTASDRMHPYIVMSLLSGAALRSCVRCGGSMFTWRGDRILRRQFRPFSRCGARCGRAATQRP
jgi:hypothetical protein